MEAVLDILKSLGVNPTFFYQLVLFCVAFGAMKWIALDSYLKMHREKVRRIQGTQKQAQEILQKVEHEEEVYREKARKRRGEIQGIFAKDHQKGVQESQELVIQAQKKAQDHLEWGEKELAEAVGKVRIQMEAQIPDLSQQIKNKFLTV